MTPVTAAFEVPPGWQRIEFPGTLGGARHQAHSRGLHPNVLVTLDKWPGHVDAERGATLLAEQLGGTDARIESVAPVAGEVPTVAARVTQQTGDEHPATVEYRLRLLPAGADTLVLTTVATFMAEQEPTIRAELDRIVASVELATSPDADA